jgi:hypothetical protein
MKYPVLLLLLLSGCAHKPVKSVSIPLPCIKAVYVKDPANQCKPAGNGDWFCKDFAVLAKDVECWKVKP